jgi:hypothetical protein
MGPFFHALISSAGRYLNTQHFLFSGFPFLKNLSQAKQLPEQSRIF